MGSFVNLDFCKAVAALKRAAFNQIDIGQGHIGQNLAGLKGKPTDSSHIGDGDFFQSGTISERTVTDSTTIADFNSFQRSTTVGHMLVNKGNVAQVDTGKTGVERECALTNIGQVTQVKLSQTTILECVFGNVANSIQSKAVQIGTVEKCALANITVFYSDRSQIVTTLERICTNAAVLNSNGQLLTASLIENSRIISDCDAIQRNAGQGLTGPERILPQCAAIYSDSHAITGPSSVERIGASRNGHVVQADLSQGIELPKHNAAKFYTIDFQDFGLFPVLGELLADCLIAPIKRSIAADGQSFGLIIEGKLYRLNRCTLTIARIIEADLTAIGAVSSALDVADADGRRLGFFHFLALAGRGVLGADRAVLAAVLAALLGTSTLSGLGLLGGLGRSAGPFTLDALVAVAGVGVVRLSAGLHRFARRIAAVIMGVLILVTRQNLLCALAVVAVLVALGRFQLTHQTTLSTLLSVAVIIVGVALLDGASQLFLGRPIVAIVVVLMVFRLISTLQIALDLGLSVAAAAVGMTSNLLLITAQNALGLPLVAVVGVGMAFGVLQATSQNFLAGLVARITVSVLFLLAGQFSLFRGVTVLIVDVQRASEVPLGTCSLGAGPAILVVGMLLRRKHGQVHHSQAHDQDQEHRKRTFAKIVHCFHYFTSFLCKIRTQRNPVAERAWRGCALASGFAAPPFPMVCRLQPNEHRARPLSLWLCRPAVSSGLPIATERA